jgi:peptidoglycan/LPS O-acetylase OafA/YrhL
MKRIHALDGLRGVLALVVVMHHASAFAGGSGFFYTSQACVWAFFVMSGLVLTRSYDGAYLTFLVRRFIRLWPLFALCLAAGWLALGRLPEPASFVRWPLNGPPMLPIGALPNPPNWSLYVEFWSALFMPAIAFFGAPGPIRKAAILPVWLMLVVADPRFVWAIFFMVGAALSRIEFRSMQLERPVPQWFGKVSFSLYLSHWPVLMLCRDALGIWGWIPGLILVLPVAWLLWRYVETPSIALSRMAGRPFLLAKPIAT